MGCRWSRRGRLDMARAWPFCLLRSRKLLGRDLLWSTVVPGRTILVLRQRCRGGRGRILTLVVMGLLLERHGRPLASREGPVGCADRRRNLRRGQWWLSGRLLAWVLVCLWLIIMGRGRSCGRSTGGRGRGCSWMLLMTRSIGGGIGRQRAQGRGHLAGILRR